MGPRSKFWDSTSMILLQHFSVVLPCSSCLLHSIRHCCLSKFFKLLMQYVKRVTVLSTYSAELPRESFSSTTPIWWRFAINAGSVTFEWSQPKVCQKVAQIHFETALLISTQYELIFTGLWMKENSGLAHRVREVVNRSSQMKSSMRQKSQLKKMTWKRILLLAAKRSLIILID